MPDLNPQNNKENLAGRDRCKISGYQRWEEEKQRWWFCLDVANGKVLSVSEMFQKLSKPINGIPFYETHLL